MGRAEQTRAILQTEAMRLFAVNGYDETTVEEIAAAAGVSHMTFFRHYPTKESVVLTDSFDPVIAAAVGASDVSLPVVERVRTALLEVVRAVPAIEDENTRARIRIAASHPRLRAGMWQNTRETGDAMVAALVATGVDRFDADVAAGACLGAITTALLDWGLGDDDESLATRITRALAVLAPVEP